MFKLISRFFSIFLIAINYYTSIIVLNNQKFDLNLSIKQVITSRFINIIRVINVPKKFIKIP
ncbi:hypothetical protein BSPA14S_K0019 (plasmid) [Borreliella spielmanii A14S]|uniref:Uncharacterized protein n=1 Tax=Borreliella spielmanii A14S TaxID=498742 RepID=C0RBS9_9SPIR|nr:hypothetical protein BSPA14S_K0019 [Borreliella spielmanii A14S]